jgi:unsaturated rhamnogalacturonyl hydrolase
MRHLPRFLLTLIVVFLVQACSCLAAEKAEKVDWSTVPSILARIKAPQFPNRDFPITEFGAKGDGQTDCTEAIKKAIIACNAAGGGRVVVEHGVFLTGAVHLLSNVNLYIAEGSTLKFSTDFSKYLPVVRARFEGTECMNYSPLIYAFQQENIAITGKGTLDGSASTESWWGLSKHKGTPEKPLIGKSKLIAMGENGVPVEERIFGDTGVLRPNFIVPYLCNNILIEGVKIVRSPMWEINPVLCSNITVRGVEIHSHGPNNDGCDPDSSRDILIEDCIFDTGDDCIAIKSGKDADGRRVGVPTENVIIRNCVMMDGHGGVVVGSEIAGSVRNVFAENCKMDSPNLERALRLKTNSGRGGMIENIYFRDVTVGRVSNSLLTIDLVYGKVMTGNFPPLVRNVVMERVSSKSSPRVLWVVGPELCTIENILVSDCDFQGVEGEDNINKPGVVTFKNVKIEQVSTHHKKEKKKAKVE